MGSDGPISFDPTRDALPQLEDPQIRAQAQSNTFRDALHASLRRKHLSEVLGPLFGSPEDSELEHLLGQVHTQFVPSGDVLFRQGEPGDAMFVVLHGRLSLSIERKGRHETLLELARGDVFGEFALLRPAPRSATATALRDTELVRIDRKQFEGWVDRYPRLALGIARSLVDRVRLANRGGRPGVSATAVAIVGHRSDPFASVLAEEVREELARLGSVLVLSSAEYDRRFHGLGAAQTRFTDPMNGMVIAVLTEQERQHDFVLYVADPDETPWSRRCIRQADRIFVVAKADDPSGPGDLERLADEISPATGKELVLVHPDSTERPQGTSRWLRRARFRAHHHLRRGDRSHRARLARRLAGRSVGLVLSGGGARGYAHLGVWRALGESHIPVDHFGGTSMGALLAAAFAIGIPYEVAVERSKVFTRPSRLFDYTLPMVALMRSRKLRKFLRELYGEQRIEDLWVPFFAVATNLTTARRRVFSQGRIRTAVRASISIPGVFVPVVERGHVLVDGGVIDNFPVEQMQHEAQTRSIIAVNVAPPRVRRRYYDLHGEVSGWRLLLNRLNPFSRNLRFPSVIATLLRALEISSVRTVPAQQDRASLLVEPDVKSIAILDFRRFKTATDLGYGSARERLNRWAAAELSFLDLPLDSSSSEQVEAPTEADRR